MPDSATPIRDEKELFNQILNLRKETDPIFKNSDKTALDKIKQLLEKTLEFFVEQRFHGESFVYEGLTPERKARLIDLATIDFMRAWIRADTNLKQNVHSFSGNRYKIHENTRGRIVYNDSRPRELWRKLKEEEYKSYLALHQQNYEGSVFSEDKPPAKESSAYGQEVPFYALWAADAALAGKLELRDQYLELKKPMGTKPNRGKLEDDYQRYLRIFQQLIPGTDSEEAMSDIEYVITSISAHELEYTYHFGLFALLARCGQEKGRFLSPDRYGEKFRRLWGRAEYIDGEQLTGQKRVVMYSPYDIFRYEQEIEFLYQDDNEEKKKFFQEHRADMIILRNILLLAGNIQLPRSLPHLTKEDLREARKFFEEDMPVYSVCNQLTGGKDEEKNYCMTPIEFRYIVKVLRFWRDLPVGGADRDKSEERTAYTSATAYYKQKLKT